MQKRHSIIESDLKAIAESPLPWERLIGKKVLVSGAAGFIPAYMVECLLYLNEVADFRIRVFGMVRNLDKARERFKAYLERPDLELLVQDLGLPLQGAPEVDIIIHAASQASPKFYAKDPVGTLRPNVLGTSNLLDLAKSSGVENFLFLSAGEIYGEVESAHLPTPENYFGRVDSLSLRSCYAESKRMGETMCVSWHQQFGVPAKIVRPYHTYGPTMDLGDGRVHADFVADILNGRNIVLKGDGSVRRVFCYLADAVLGFFTVLLKGKDGEAYNIANSDAEVTVLELAERLVKLFPEKGLQVVREKRPEGSNYLPSPLTRTLPDIAKARALGWKPLTGIEDGFSKTIRSYQ